ncbi:hypothetical protein NOR_04311 [Metarhizium rileyi]|uniref:Uncharacterized protein n=1 Tax=Metarhizium rileyi (strain RCEF 4871) TaxID=1649241 RepID=A0A167EDJ2_METRR|nr:hypothetical protein NOR_04311 [Metarhizium rileyi RCEF 4871]
MKTCIIILSAAFASFSIAGPVTKRLRKDIPSATELCGPFHGNDKACHYALGQCMLKKPKDIETLLQCVHAAADGVVGRPYGGIDCKPGIQGICRRKEQQKQPEENKEQQQPEENKKQQQQKQPEENKEQQQPEENKKQQQQQKQPEENKKKKSRPPFFAPGTDWHRSGKLTILVPR